MNKIYLVYHDQGSWDCYQRQNICAFKSELDAINLCEKSEKREIELEAVSNTIREHIIEWAKLNKEPDFPRYNPDDIDIFKEWDAWDNAKCEAELGFIRNIDGLNNEERQRLCNYFYTREYKIEQIEVK